MVCWEEEPYKVVQFLNPVTVRIKKRNGRKDQVVHIDKLKKVVGAVEEQPPPSRRKGRGNPGSNLYQSGRKCI